MSLTIFLLIFVSLIFSAVNLWQVKAGITDLRRAMARKEVQP